MAEHTEQALTDLRQLRARSRRLAHGGAWLPALLLAAVTLGSAFLYRYPFAEPTAESWRHPYWAGLPAEPRGDLAAYLFWFLGLPLTVAATGAWYRWRSRRHGVKIAWPWYAGITCAVLALLAVIAAVPSARGSSGEGWPGLLTPLLAVAVAAIALGAVERSKPLIFGGAWLGLVAAWHCALGMGGLPGWVTWLLGGGEGPALGGQLTLLGLNRPGPVLVLMTAPLLVIGIHGLWRARR